jgi:hypothetical protein
LQSISASFYFSHFDASVLSFLKEFQRNSLLANVNLNLAYVNSANDLNALPSPQFMLLMANVVPLLTNINLINVVGNNVLLDLMEKGNAELTFRMLASARVLHAWSGFHIRNITNDWTRVRGTIGWAATAI